MNDGRRPSPEEILTLSPEEADRLLTHLERRVPVHPPWVELPSRPDGQAIVFGDSHGDWRSTREVVGRLEEDPPHRILVGLGDYVDRAPDDAGEGSVANALYLLALAAEAPDRVVLLQGNHETDRRIAVVPHDLPEEVDSLWGPVPERAARLAGLLERGPLAAGTSTGVYFAHAGFPLHRPRSDWRHALDAVDEETLAEVVWAECGASRLRRGGAPAWTAADLTRFFEDSGFRVFVRGHDPDLTGRAVYGGRCLTLHSTRVFERYGGVLCARVPLDSPVRSADDVRVEHLATEGRSYPPV